MELLQLTYFCDAAESQNFSRTAEKYLVPPSNISQSVKRLEAELGVCLFARNKNRVRLNAAGHAFLCEVKAALRHLERAKEAVRETEGRGSIRINVHIDRRVVMQVVERFRTAFPRVAIAVTHEPQKGDAPFDLVVSDRPLSFAEFFSEKVAEEAIVLWSRRTET